MVKKSGIVTSNRSYEDHSISAKPDKTPATAPRSRFHHFLRKPLLLSSSTENYCCGQSLNDIHQFSEARSVQWQLLSEVAQLYGP